MSVCLNETNVSVDLSIIVPFYNEADSLQRFFDVIIPILRDMNITYELICINDGSKDNTLDLLIQKKQQIKNIKIINFSRNFGKDAALTAGLDFAQGKCVIPIDSDLQDPPDLIPEMFDKWKSGFDVVLAKRVQRSTDTFMKRTTACLFYKIYNLLSGIKLPENVGDFRLLDRKVVNAIQHFSERTRFMKGIFAAAGFKTSVIEYERPLRCGGQTKWNYWKLVNYAIHGITSFSIVPLRAAMFLGFTVTTLAFCRAIWICFKVLFCGIDVPGYASLMVAMLLLGGIQLITLGIIGEYVGRTYEESKKRPIYIVRDIF